MSAPESAAVADRHYTTLGVARATGIPATTILAWERRYGVPQPERGPDGRRRYSAADVELLLAMRARTADGVRAETAAREVLAEPGALHAPRPSPVYLPTDVKEIHCLHCGATSGELYIQHVAHGVQTRFVRAPGAPPPRRGPGAKPRCGRCDGALFAEPLEQRSLPPFPDRPSARPRRGAA
ncbi:MAG TPA: MerR family transcriptional regulator [Chloroflexota bacterium]|nr:MerR family transcriptional regulator [Chloroflexota bacterium]